MKSLREEGGGRSMTEQQAATLDMLRKTAANGFALTLTATQICQVLELCESGWQCAGIADDQIATLTADKAALRAALKRYGRHLDGCPARRLEVDDRMCTCGLHVAIVGGTPGEA